MNWSDWRVHCRKQHISIQFGRSCRQKGNGPTTHRILEIFPFSMWFFLSFQLLIVISAISMALGLICLGVYMMLKSWNIDVSAFGLVPLISFAGVVFVSQLGVLSLPFIVLAEIMPEKIKDQCVSFCMSLLWVFAFLTIKYFPALNELLGFHGSMFLFAGVCFGGALFVILFMPETKCKSHEDIMKSLE